MMENSLREALRRRRSHYALRSDSPVPDERIIEIVRFAVRYVPSAFNSQSTRAVLLLGNHHVRLWRITLDRLREVAADDEAFSRTRDKVERAFASGYGTVLFYEDTDVVRTLQRLHPLYFDRFPIWSEQTSAMHQLVVWTLLEEEGFGASLQHYDPLIDEPVRHTWNLPASWRLIAQMPFGLPAAEPPTKSYEPLDERVRIFR